MIVAKNCYFWSVFPQISCGGYLQNSSKFPKPHFFLTCTYFGGRRHGRNLPMAKATDGLAFGITRHCRIEGLPPMPPTPFLRGGVSVARGHLGISAAVCVFLSMGLWLRWRSVILKSSIYSPRSKQSGTHGWDRYSTEVEQLFFEYTKFMLWSHSIICSGWHGETSSIHGNALLSLALSISFSKMIQLLFFFATFNNELEKCHGTHAAFPQRCS